MSSSYRTYSNPRCASSPWGIVPHSFHRRAKLFRLAWFNLCLTPFSTQRHMALVYFSNCDCQIYEQQTTKTNAPARFLPQGFGQDDNTFASGVCGRRGGPENKNSRSCRFLASVFHLRRWRRNRWSSAGSWLAGKVWQHGENARARVMMGYHALT